MAESRGWLGRRKAATGPHTWAAQGPRSSHCAARLAVKLWLRTLGYVGGRAYGPTKQSHAFDSD
eukprot:10107839-Alexandrium_andersonii.AAC.2